MRLGRKHAYLVWLLLLLPCAGCTSVRWYSGPALPRDKVALLVCYEGISGYTTVDVHLIDGRPLYPQGTPKYVHLRPGTHTVQIAYRNRKRVPPGERVWVGSTEDIVVEFEARPGQLYSVAPNADLVAMTWNPQVVETKD